jgi:hypothetical protein
MKKFSLVFDANFWLMKTFNICQKIKQGKGMNFINEPEEDKQFLLWKLASNTKLNFFILIFCFFNLPFK